MEKENRFYKEANGSWYIDLPEWEEDKSALQMVLGADTLLDAMAGSKNEIDIKFADYPFDGCARMGKINNGIDGDETSGGATYFIMHDDVEGIPHSQRLWLCDVVKFIFGEMPDFIYFNYANK